ncbi:MAG: ammonia channel protein, partial [Syntrophaceae bacterium]
LEWQRNGTPTVLGVVTGAVAGLVAITPACGFVSILSAIPIGIVVSVICFFAVTMLKQKLGYDDALDVFGIHGVGGTWGTIATGIFASKLVNEAGADGLIFGNVKLLMVQGVFFLVCAAYAVIATFILFKVVDALIGIRVTAREETIGLDLTQHSEAAYTILE